MRFNDWLENDLSFQIKRISRKKRKLKSWLDLLVDPDKMPILYPLVSGADTIIRFESLEQDFNQLLKEAKIIGTDDWIDIPNKNPTPGKTKYQDYYSEKFRAFVEDNFSKELAALDYQFEELTTV